MSKDGLEYYLITFEKRNTPESTLLFYNKQFLRDRFTRMGVNWCPLVYHKRPFIFSTLYDMCIGIFYGIFISIKRGIDFIHAQTYVGAAIAFPIALLLRKKIIYDANGLLTEEYADIGVLKRESVFFKVANYLEKMFILRADGVIFISGRMSEKIIRGDYIPHKKRNWNFEVIPSHVDMGRFKFSGSKDTKLEEKYNLKGKFVLIYIGSLGTWYMLSEMLDFFKVAKQNIPNAIFLILSHTEKNAIREEVYKKGIREQDVIITEALPDEIPGYLSVADAGIFFIKPVFSKEACSPVKLGEYLALGLPVVINSKIGVTEELIKSTNTGVVVTKFEDAEYKRAILELKNLIETDKKLKDKCFKTAQKHFSIEAALEKYSHLYESIFLIK
jgi:glycosyltransferase involved in cell wall biosynthesis